MSSWRRTVNFPPCAVWLERWAPAGLCWLPMLRTLACQGGAISAHGAMQGMSGQSIGDL